MVVVWFFRRRHAARRVNTLRQPAMENPINYYYKGYKTMGDISTRDAGWTNTATIFRVPSGIRQPTLVTITWQGGDRYEYAGVRLD